MYILYGVVFVVENISANGNAENSGARSQKLSSNVYKTDTDHILVNLRVLE